MNAIKNLMLLLFALGMACNDCHHFDCEPNGGIIKLRLLSNGQNVLYGPGAFISQDSIKFFVLSSIEIERNVSLLDTFQAIAFAVDESTPSILAINGVRADTFSVTTEIVELSECCADYELTSVARNGQVVCSGVCEGVIEIEI